MSAKTIVMCVFASLLFAVAVTIFAGIWTGDIRWFQTAALPGALALLNFCFLPVILLIVEEGV